MKYFKNIEVSRLFGIHPTTVTNYINGSRDGRNNLILIEKNGRYFLADNEHNRIEIERLSEEGKKYARANEVVEVEASPRITQIFSNENLAEIINNIENHSEIPNKFTYLNGGAVEWHQYAQNSVDQSLTNAVTNTMELLDSSVNYLENILDKGYRYNIFDIGVGDLTPVKPFVKELLSRDKINKYIGIDFSQEMLEIAKDKFIEEFGSSFTNFEMIKKDINKDNLIELLFQENNSHTNVNTRNLLLFLGSTIENQRDKLGTLLNVSASLGKEDLLMIGETTDSESSKGYFNFSVFDKKEYSIEKISYRDKWILEAFGITEDMYSVKMYYDEDENCRYTKIYPESEIRININTANFNKVVVLKKAKPIILWRHSHQSYREIVDTLDLAGLSVLSSATSKDKAQVVLTCQLKD